MSEPDTRACELDQGRINVCVEMFREALREQVATEGLPCEVDITTQTPAVPSIWLAAIECPHGVMYWIEPTAATVETWERERAWE